MGIFDKIAGFFEDIFGAIGDALSWLLGVPDADDYAGQLINKNSNVANLPVVYGRRLVGGTRVFVSTGGNNKNEYMYIVLALSEGEINAVNSVYVNDKLMIGTPVPGKPYRKVTGGDYKDIIWYQTFTGTDDQTACTTLFNDIGNQGPDDSWTSAHRLRGVAYIAMVVKYHQDKGMTSIPEIRCEIQGRKVYDPRTETTVWTSNPALCLRDYLTNERFGKGLPDSAIDDEAFGAAATFCDSTVSSYTGGPSINTFSLNMILDTGNTLFDNTKRFLLAMRGIMPYSEGKYSLIIDKDDASVGTIDESICTRDITIKSVNKNTKLNQVKAVFVNPYKRYEQDSVIWPPADSLEESTFLAEDNNQVLSKDLTLDTVTNFYQARELARVAVLASRSSSIICELVCTSEALKYAVGDIITLEQPSMGWVGPAAKEFRILSIQLAVSGEVGLTLQEYDSSIYPWVTGSEQDDQPETTLPNPNSVDAITTASVTTGSQVLNDGTIQYFADLTWTPPSDELIQDYVVKINKKVGSVTTENVETITTINNKARYILTDTNAEYGYSIQARNGAQVTSEPLTVAPVAVVTDTTAPAPIQSGTISAIEGLEVIAISWTNPTDPDFDLVNIKVSDTTTEPTEVFAQVRSNTFVHEVNEYNKTKYYWLATVDTSGNISAYTSAGPFSTGQPDYNDLTNTPTIPTIPEVAGTFYISLGDSNAPTDTEFNTAVGRDPLENDFVIVSYPDGTGTSTKGYNYNGDPLAWTEVTEYIDGSMIVTGSLSASDITTGTLNANDVTISNLTVSYGSQVTDKPDLSVYLTDSDIENLVTLKDVQESGFAPYQTWDFQNSADGWSASGITATNNADYISLVSTTTDPTFSENGLTINGGIYDTVLVRIRRTAGDGWQGTLYYSTGEHGSSEDYRQIVPDTTVLNEWVILTYDMHNLNQGGDDWKNNTIYGLRFDWGSGAPNDAFDIDWIAVGKRGSVPISEYDIKDFITGGDVNTNVTSISGGVIQAGTAITVGTGDNVAILSGADTTYRLWAGNATSTDAPFAVTQTGILSATGAIIDGNITANSLDVENATVTGTFVAPIGWSNNIYSGVINRGNLNESVKDLIDERIAEVTGGISGDFGQDDGYFSHIAQGNPDPDDPIVLNITHETGKNLTVELSGSRSWNREFVGLPETDMGVSITLERSPSGADTWTTLTTLTDTGSSITTSTTQLTGTTYAYSISIYHVLTDDQASGNYDYRARTTIAGSAYNVGIPLQLTVVEPATVGAGNADTLDNQDGTYYLDYNNFTNTPTIPDVSGKADLSGDTFTGNVNAPSFTGRLQGAVTGAPDATIWCVSGQYTDWGIFYDEDTPDLIQFKSSGNTKASIALDNGNINTLGTITASGYNNSNWDTAYGWGDHSTQGYLTSTWSSDITWQNAVNINTYGETSFDMRQVGSQWGVWTLNDSQFSIKVPYSGQVVIGEAGSRGLSVVGNLGVSGGTTAYGFLSSGADDTPAGTGFSNAFKGQGTYRAVYFDGDGTSVSTWYGVGNNPFSAIDSTEGVMDFWVNPSNGTWYNIFDSSTSGVNIKTGGLLVSGTQVIDASRNLNNVGTVNVNDKRGLNLLGYSHLGQTGSGAITVLGHNVQVSDTVNNRASTVNGSWYGHAIAMYYDNGITFHTTPSTVSAGTNIIDGIGQGTYERLRIKTNGNINVVSGDLEFNGTEVIDAGRNIKSVTTLSVSDSASNGTSNGMSHYQWDGATYRNPSQWTARQVLRIHNDSVGDNGHIPSLVLYNESGLLNSTVGMSFATREADGSGNSVPMGGIQATKTLSGNSGAWSSGKLTAYVKDLGTRRNVWTAETNGNLSVHQSLTVQNDIAFGNFTLCRDGSSLGWGAKAGVQVYTANEFRFHASSGNLDVWVDGKVNAYDGYQIAGTTVISSARDATFNNLVVTRSGHNYLEVNGNGSYEAMTRYNNSISNLWYTGIRTSTQLVGNTGYHIYSTAAGQTVWGLTAGGEMRAKFNVVAYYSDERLKTKVSDINDALDKVCSLNGFIYIENEKARELGYNSKKQQVALSAQEVKKVLPQAVSLAPIDCEIDKDGNEKSISGENYLTVDYARLVPMLVEAIKELKSEIEELKNANSN